jgi:putative NADPH-quinone reductase
MNILILDGGPADGRGATGHAIAADAVRKARAAGHAVTSFELDGLNIKPCLGCFACWVKHPGTCAVQDDHGPIVEAMARADAQVWITPVTFGGYSSVLKKALDRLIPNILPFFEIRQDEVHHPPRYDRRRRLFVLGTAAVPDDEAEGIFHRVVERNALNLNSVLTDSFVVREGAAEEAASRIGEFLRAAEEVQ